MEYELLDTGIFDDDRYFDVFVEYAKAGADRHPDPDQRQQSRARDRPRFIVLPTLWFRNIWTWWPEPAEAVPAVEAATQGNSVDRRDRTPSSATYYLHCEGDPPLLFTENETNNERLFGTPNATPYVKDGINDFVVAGRQDAVNPQQAGTKAAAHYQLTVGAGRDRRDPAATDQRVADRPAIRSAASTDMLATRRREADAFYSRITPTGVGDDAANVMRQALAGMLWSKQYYLLRCRRSGSQEHGVDPLQIRRRRRCATATGST